MTKNGSIFCSSDLLRVVQRIVKKTPLTNQLEDALRVGPGYGRAWYSCQQEHWLRWLEGYHTEGPYGRRPCERTPAERVYNRVICPPMVFWLAEAVGVDHAQLCRAFAAAIGAPGNLASQAAAVRSELPWQMVFVSIEKACTDNGETAY